MFGSSILDVAIGMALIYMLLSLIASAIQEALASLVQTRSANLERGIRSLFSGSTLNNGKEFIEALYTHGLIRGLYQDPVLDVPKIQGPVTRWGHLYAACMGLVHAVRDCLRCIVRFFLRVEKMPRIKGVHDPYLMPAYIPSRTFAVAMLDILNPDKENGKLPLENIKTHLVSLCENQAHREEHGAGNIAAKAMLALLTDAQSAKNNIERFRSNLENWYNDAMDRVSGWYKKDTQIVLFFIGLTLALIFNVDSLRVGRTLWFDRDARQGLVSAASNYVQKPSPNETSLSEAQQAEALKARMQETITDFSDVSQKYLLPVGWPYPLEHYKSVLLSRGPTARLHLVGRLIGWIITALALSLGAPFWFDTLNKFMVVRGTVKPSEKSGIEVSKDK